MLTGAHHKPVKVGNHADTGKYRRGFRGDFLRAVAAGDMGQQQLADAGPVREAGRGGGGQVPARAGERLVAVEKCRLDHQRVGAAHRNRSSEATSSTSPTIASLAPANSAPCTICGAISLAVGERYRAARGQLAPRRPVGHAERCEAIGEQRVAGGFLEPPAEALGPAMGYREGVEPPARPRQDRAGRHRAQPVAGPLSSPTVTAR